MKQLDGLVEDGNTVIVVEHDMSVAAASDWIIDIGAGMREDRSLPPDRRERLLPRNKAGRPNI
jgi:ABC-type lipoprotein export system ATPase subunit